MNKSSVTLRRLTLLLLGVAALLGGCSVWDDLARESGSFTFCYTIGDPVKGIFIPIKIDQVGDVLEKAVGKDNYVIRDDQGHKRGGLAEGDCCGVKEHHKHHKDDGPHTGSVNVTQKYKVSSLTNEDALKAVADLLKSAR